MKTPRWTAWIIHMWFAMRAQRARRAFARFCAKRDRWFRRATGGEP